MALHAQHLAKLSDQRADLQSEEKGCWVKALGLTVGN